MLGSSGSVLFAQVFDPYGNPYASAGTEITSGGFTGEQTDANGLVFLPARHFNPRVGRFLQRDPWRGLAQQSSTLNPYLYVRGNPINLLDPAGKWICRGHPDRKDWVENALRILLHTSKTGRAIVDFFKKYDEKIKKTQPGGYIEPSCDDSLLIPNGVLIEFGTPWPGPSWGTAIFSDVLQLSDNPEVINGPLPEGFGLQLFGHEVSHWAQGVARLTIQGELLARYLEKQLRLDLESQYGKIKHGEDTETLITHFNPFYVERLQEAKEWMITNWSSGYIIFPLPSVGGLDQSWLDRFYVRVNLAAPPSEPLPIPTPPPPIPPIGTPVPPPLVP
ncbi:MAG: RHS repeat-associated core domain-containing protein [Anaerolineales bacterium]